MNTALDKENSEEFDPFSCKLSYPFLDLVLCSCTLLVGVVVLNSKSRRLTCMWVWYVVFAVSSLFFFLIVSICWYIIVDLFYTETPTQTFAGTVKLDQDYYKGYDDINSPRSRALITVLDSKLKPFFKKKFSDFIDINYKSFFKGSVGVDYELLFPATSTVTGGNIVQALRKVNGSSELGFLRLTGEITVTKQVVQTTAAPTATKGKLQCPFIFYIAFMLLAFKEVQCNLTCIKVSTTLSVLLH